MPSAQRAGDPVQTRFTFAAADAARFREYHDANPAIYAALRRFALEAVAAGKRRLSINLLFERLRWFTDVEAKGDAFKCNNTYRAHYARLLMDQEPELAGVFETRRSAATCGATSRHWLSRQRMAIRFTRTR